MFFIFAPWYILQSRASPDYYGPGWIAFLGVFTLVISSIGSDNGRFICSIYYRLVNSYHFLHLFIMDSQITAIRLHLSLIKKKQKQKRRVK